MSIYLCRHLPVFPNNSVKSWAINLKIGMLYHMNNTFQNPVFWKSSVVPLMNKELSMAIMHISRLRNKFLRDSTVESKRKYTK